MLTHQGRGPPATNLRRRRGAPAARSDVAIAAAARDLGVTARDALGWMTQRMQHTTHSLDSAQSARGSDELVPTVRTWSRCASYTRHA